MGLKTQGTKQWGGLFVVYLFSYQLPRMWLLSNTLWQPSFLSGSKTVVATKQAFLLAFASILLGYP